jgi:hypothetical protein
MRPTTAAQNCALVDLGNKSQFAEYENGRNPADPVAGLEQLLAHSGRIDHVQWEPNDDSVGHLIQVLLTEVRELQAGSGNEKLLGMLVDAATANHRVLTTWLANYLSDFIIDQGLSNAGLEVVLPLLSGLSRGHSGEFDPFVLRQLWQACPLAAAAIENPYQDDDAADSWRVATGWPILAENEAANTLVFDLSEKPKVGDPIPQALIDKTDEVCADMRLMVTSSSSDVGFLAQGGQFDAMFEFLLNRREIDDSLKQWLGSLPAIMRQSDMEADQLRSAEGLPQWTRFPREVQRCASLVISGGMAHPDVLVRTLKAFKHSPLLVLRSLFFAIAATKEVTSA